MYSYGYMQLLTEVVQIGPYHLYTFLYPCYQGERKRTNHRGLTIFMLFAALRTG
jgi:hypothetical protein